MKTWKDSSILLLSLRLRRKQEDGDSVKTPALLFLPSHFILPDHLLTYPYLAGMPLFQDQTGRSVAVSGVPERIISIVPSQTELLYHLGLGQEVAGITKFCVHPNTWFRNKQRIGGTKNLNLQRIRELGPHLILANKEENDRDQVEELAKEFPVWTSDIHDLPSALDMIRSVGILTGKADRASVLANDILKAFAGLRPGPPVRTAYLIWKDPYMTAGGDTFIHEMLQRCGLQNLFAEKPRYPATSVEELGEAGCELLLLSSEPYPFSEKHIAGLQARLPHARILLVDGEMFSWYGSRLLLAPPYFARLTDQLHSNPYIR